MEVMGRLAAGVSHDFNNILQVILGGTDILKDEASLSPAAESFLDAVESAALRGAYLTHHLLSYSRKQTLHPKPVDPGQVMEKLRVMLVRTLPSNIAVTIRAPAGSGLVRVDRAQLETALMNLAINAAHAMPDGGALLMEAGFTDSATGGASGGGERPGALKPGRYAVVAVEDNGVGMSPEVLACAFDPFFTTKGVDGTGLGLAMVQGFSRQSGGDVRATSAPGQGTRFEIWLPEDPGAEPEPAAPVPRASLRTGTVLLVDDSRDVLVTIGAFLRHGGYTVEHAEGGHQALKLLAAGRRFDALVSDYMMPGLSGLELVKRARDVQPELPAVIISGYAEVTDFMTGLPNASLLQKPFQRAEFLATLSALVAGDAGLAMENAAGSGSSGDPA
jgi:CheY-like chemotaxis protein